MELLRTVEGELNRLFIFRLPDGYRVEGVLYRGDTLCVSTQVGCPVRCLFCASGRQGLVRNLRAGEIYGQVRERYPVRRVAVAGIGEPLANWRNVREAFLRFRSEGVKVSFYTCGFPLRNLAELLRMPHSGVTISVHTLNADLRRRLMPHAGDPDPLIRFLREALPSMSAGRRKRVALAYLLLKGVNDSEEDIVRLGELAKDLGLGVTLLRYNEVGSFRSVNDEEYERAFLLLRGLGVKVTLSTRFRRERTGGCGTLTVGGV